MLRNVYLCLLLTLFASYGLFSCGNDSSATSEEQAATPITTEKAPGNTPPAKAEAPAPTAAPFDVNASELLIQESGIAGVYQGQLVDELIDRITKDMLKTGEGDFVVYRFNSSDGQPLGYFTTDPENEGLVGDIVVTSTEAATQKGIKVGATFAELQAALPDVIVHGSEIEGRTHAVSGTIAYLLNAHFNTYEVDVTQVKPSAQVKHIRITRHSSKY